MSTNVRLNIHCNFYSAISSIIHLEYLERDRNCFPIFIANLKYYSYMQKYLVVVITVGGHFQDITVFKNVTSSLSGQSLLKLLGIPSFAHQKTVAKKSWQCFSAMLSKRPAA